MCQKVQRGSVEKEKVTDGQRDLFLNNRIKLKYNLIITTVSF